MPKFKTKKRLSKKKRESNLIYDRKNGILLKETICGEGSMKFVYRTKLGKAIGYTVLKRRFFTRLCTASHYTRFSRRKIQKFVNRYNINMDEALRPMEDYRSFNDFFTRQLKEGARQIDLSPQVLISPADSKCIAYPIQDGMVFSVKGIKYSLGELVRDQNVAEEYRDGICLVFRLAPTDYHRFCSVDRGVREIKGHWNTVNTHYAPKKVHATNYRQVCTIRSENFGLITEIDVGAMMVGKIIQHKPMGGILEKGEEKGYFEFGGSTVVLLFKRDRVALADDILQYSALGIECIVRMGESIGRKH
jgi:phosphatidylserine decarboxylase